MNFDILKRTIFLALSGSRAYGFSNPDSDYDYRGIVIPPLDTYVGIKDKFEQAVSKELWKQFTKPISSQDLVSEGADMQVYELSKFVRLAAQCNPSIIEILFTDPSFYVEPPHPVMDHLLYNKNLFLSKQAKARFCGYALSQLNRIKRHKKWIDDPPTAPPVRADFGLADKKLISLDQLGAAEAIIDHELSKFMVEQTDLPEHTKIELSAEMGRTLKFAWQALHQDKPFPVGGDQIFDSVEEAQRLAIARYEGFSENFLVILDAEKRYRAAKQHWDSYVHWLQERNPVRAELERKHGYDSKHATHLVRLIRMAREILETGQVQVFRADAEELRSIRAGAWTYEKIIEFAEQEDIALIEVAKNSKLPKSPDINKIHEITFNMIMDFNANY